MNARSKRKRTGDGEHIGMLLRKLADLVEKLSADEVRDVLRGNWDLRIGEADSGASMSETGSRGLQLEATFAEVAGILHAAETREAGCELLGNRFPTRVVTEEFARFLDLPVYRTDTVGSLREKIVEAEIGSRLRTEAVRGTKL